MSFPQVSKIMSFVYGTNIYEVLNQVLLHQDLISGDVKVDIFAWYILSMSLFNLFKKWKLSQNLLRPKHMVKTSIKT